MPAGSPGYSASPPPSVRRRFCMLAADANWPVAVRATAAPTYACDTTGAVECRLEPRCMGHGGRAGCKLAPRERAAAQPAQHRAIARQPPTLSASARPAQPQRPAA